MALVKLGSVKKTDLVISGSVNLSTDVGSSILPVANGGTGNGSFTNGQLLIGNTTGNTLTKATLTQASANQVIITNGNGAITLSLPQDIGTASNVTFGGITIASGGEAKFPNNGLHISDSSESGAYLTINCVDVTLTSPGRNLGIKVNDAARTLNLTGNATLDQDVSTVGSPTFGGLTLTTPLSAANGGTGITSLGANVATALGVNVGSAGAFVTFNGSLGTPSSGTLTNCTGLPVSTGVSGLGSGVSTFLATPSSANLAAAVTDETGSGSVVFGASPTLTNVTINQAANGDTAIKSVRNTDTNPTGNFVDFQSASASSIYKVDRFGALAINVTAQASTAERLLTLGVSDSGSTFTLDNGTTNPNFFNPTFSGTIEAGVEGVPISFFGTKGVDTTTNPAILFLYRHNTGGGNTDLSSTVTGVEFRNRATKGFGFTGGHNFQMCGGATSPSLFAATADIVSQAAVDNGAGNREWQCQPESGGFFALGNNKFRRVSTSNQDVYDWCQTVNTTDATQTTLATIPITASRTYMIEARVAARRTGGSAGTADDGASYVRRGTYTTKSGTVTLMGSVQTIGTDAEDQSAWDVTLTISGTNVLVRVTGAANNNVTWMGDVKVQSVAS